MSPMTYFILEYRYQDLAARERTRADHLDYMQSLHASGSVVMGGPTAGSAGAVVVFDVADEAAVHDLVAGDPYTREGVASDHAIRRWDVVIPAQDTP